MKEKIVIICIFLVIPFFAMAQIGINIESPEALLTIKSASSTKPVVIARNSNNTELMRLLDNGYMGMSKTNPIVKLDLRATGLLPNGEIGLGTTSQTAASAKAGAIRYNNKGIEYSDGTKWIRLTTLPTRAYVVAKNAVAQSSVGESSLNLKNWTVDMDATGSFNASLGYFTAPRTGVYSVSCTAMIENIISETNPLRVELNLIIASSTSAPVKSGFAVPNPSGVSGLNITCVNKSFLYLAAGDTFYFSIWHNINPRATTTTDPSYNTLTISEM